MSMRLLYAPPSPFARKVRVLIAEKHLTGIEQVQVSPFDKPEELTVANPLSKVPVLIRDSAVALYDSPVICEFLDSLNSDARLLPPDGEARWDMLRRQALADGMMDTTLALALEVNRRPEHQRSPDWIARWVETLERTLDALEAEFPAWPGGFDLGHIAAACALSYLDLRASGHLDWRDGRPVLAAWFADVGQRPSMTATEVPA